MFTQSYGRPFTDALNALRSRGYRFQDLSVRSDEARSTAWFNNLVNSDDPWAVAPPSDRTWPGLAQLLGITEAHLRELIAAEWFGVKASVIPGDTRTFVDLAADLPPRDVELLTAIARRLKQGPRQLTRAEALNEVLDDLNAPLELPDYFAGLDEGNEKP